MDITVEQQNDSIYSKTLRNKSLPQNVKENQVNNRYLAYTILFGALYIFFTVTAVFVFNNDQKLSNAEERIAALENSKTSAQVAKSGTHSTLEALRDIKIPRLKRLLQDEEADQAAARQELIEALEEAVKKANELETNIENLEDTIRELDTQSKRDISDLKSSVSSEKSRLDDKHEDNDKKLNPLKVKLAAIETEVKNTEKGVSELVAQSSTTISNIFSNKETATKENTNASTSLNRLDIDANKKVSDVGAMIEKVRVDYNPEIIKQEIDAYRTQSENTITNLRSSFSGSFSGINNRIEDLSTYSNGLQRDLLSELASLRVIISKNEEEYKLEKRKSDEKIGKVEERIAREEDQLPELVGINTNLQTFMVDTTNNFEKVEATTETIHSKIIKTNDDIILHFTELTNAVTDHKAVSDSADVLHTTDIASVTDNLAEAKDSIIKRFDDDELIAAKNKEDLDAEFVLINGDLVSLKEITSDHSERITSVEVDHTTLYTEHNSHKEEITTTVNKNRADSDESFTLAYSRVNSTETVFSGLSSTFEISVSEVNSVITSHKEAETTLFSVNNRAISTEAANLEEAKSTIESSILSTNTTIHDPAFYNIRKHRETMYEYGPTHKDILSLLHSGGGIMEVHPEAVDFDDFWDTYTWRVGIQENLQISGLQIGVGESDEDGNNGFVIDIPEGYDTLIFQTYINWEYSTCHFKGNYTDNGEIIGSWGGSKPHKITPMDNIAPRFRSLEIAPFAIPNLRPGKILLYSGQNNDCYITELTFAKNLHGHAATLPSIFLSAFNGGFLDGADYTLVYTDEMVLSDFTDNMLPNFKIPVVPNGKKKLIYIIHERDNFEETNGVQYTSVNDIEIRMKVDIDNVFSRTINRSDDDDSGFYGAIIPEEADLGDSKWLDFEIYSDSMFRLYEIGTIDADML